MTKSTKICKFAVKQSVVKFVKRLLFWVLLVPIGVSLLLTLAYRWVPVYLSPLMLIRSAQQSGNGEPVKLHHVWVPMDEISPHLRVAVMASEDQRFLEHGGFDTAAIRLAAKEYIEGKRIRGGSTISQQTVKNVFLWPNQSWLRKGLEAYFTVLIEWMWSKDRIMEVYLNTIEMGPGIYGAQAVAEEHFGCDAAELKRDECALIAATLPNPLKYSSARPSKYMLKRQRQILKQMDYIDAYLKRMEK